MHHLDDNKITEAFNKFEFIIFYAYYVKNL